MRVYFVQVQTPESKQWVTVERKFHSCRKAHSAAKHSPTQPARVLCTMETTTLKLPKA